MKSAVQYHFPIVKIEEKNKWLYNPILKKRFKNRPEERVRLKWVDYLLLEAGWNKSRIGFETPIKLRQKKHSVRADLLLYTSQLKPFILIECKAESVSVQKNAAEQAARYNTEVGADYIVLSNGVDDFSFRTELNRAVPDTLPIMNEYGDSEFRDINYWSDRGFCGVQKNLSDQNQISAILKLFWSDAIESEIRYLAFEDSYLPIPMEQYYRIFNIETGIKMAMSFVGTNSSTTYMVAVLNRKGINDRILVIDLEKMMKGEYQLANIYTDRASIEIDTGSSLKELLLNFKNETAEKLSTEVMNFFSLLDI
ncbi:MAG: type I restriction enzyme HsdR N-terminal domain-containing protein [Balneolaceae bacterium]